MTSTERIILNTGAQYTRTIINVCLALYSTRLILAALGQNDLGIYYLVAGVVSMLSFITNALSTATQRFLSFNLGKKEDNTLYRIFGNSMLLHIFIGLGVMLILFILTYPIIYKALNIPTERLNAAAVVYVLSVIMLFVSIMIAPIRALYIARENIVFISIVDIIDGVLKLGFAFILLHSHSDRLILYSVFMLGIQVLNFIVLVLYANRKFPEYHFPHYQELDKSYLIEFSSFTGWTVYSQGCIIARNQGIAVALNHFLGTVVNAAYGIAMQVSGAMAFISSSIVNAMNPQIMKSEGAGDRNRMIRIAEYESKYSFMLLAIVAIPIIAEMDTILHLWLEDVPPYTSAFCKLILLAGLCDQLTIGLTAANQAVGQIRNYTLIFYSFKLLTLIGVCLCLYTKIDASYVLWCYVIIEFLDSLLRLPLLKRQAGINIAHFCKKVFLPTIIPIAGVCLVAFLSVHFIQLSYRFILTCALSILTAVITIWIFALDREEKDMLKSYIKKE